MLASMFDHSQPAEYVLDRLSFRHDNQHYSGRGILSWDPEKGVHINGFLSQLGPDTRFQNPGAVEIQDRGDQYPVRFIGYGFNGIVPRVFARNLGSLLHERRLFIEADQAIFFITYS